MKHLQLTMVLIGTIVLACSPDTDAPDTGNGSVMEMNNPLLAEWRTPFGVPPFDRIESRQYLPALRAGMAEHKEEIAAITSNPEAPTFTNTIEALEAAGGTYDRVSRAFRAVDGAHSDEVTRETARIIAPEAAAHRDDIRLNSALFERVATIYDQRGELSLDHEQMRLLEEAHKKFIRSGIELDQDSQTRLREIPRGFAKTFSPRPTPSNYWSRIAPTWAAYHRI
jgi:peptidyl-dipeptidase Dcp